MAVVTVTFDGVRVDDCEDASTWASLGAGGAGPQNETDFFFQNTQGVSRKIGTTIGGQDFDYSGTGSVDMTAADRKMWMAKIQATNKDKLLTNGSPSMELRVGSSSADYYQFDVFGSDDYPIKGGWVIFPLDPNQAAYRSGSGGTPALTTVDYFGFQCDFSGTSKSENVVIDAVDVGRGLCLVGGDGADPDGTLDDFLGDDQEDVTNGRFGYFTELDGIVTVYGMHWIGRNDSGTTVVTEYTDRNKVVLFPDGLFDAGESGFSFDIGNASTVIAINNYTFLSDGNDAVNYFDIRTEANGGFIDDATDEIRFTAPHRYKNGDYILYTNEIFTTSVGLTDSTNYWVRVVNDFDITLHTGSRRNALANASIVNLTGAGATVYENHKIAKVIDTRACVDYGATLTGSATFTSCVYINFCPAVIAANAAHDFCTFDNCGQMTISSSSGELDDCTIKNNRLGRGVSQLVADTTAATDGSIRLTMSADTSVAEYDRGHGIEFTATGAYLLNDYNFIGYHGGTGSDKSPSFSFNTETGVDAGTDQIEGDAPRVTLSTTRGYWYEKRGGTEAIGLNDGQLYWLESKGLNDWTVHLTEQEAVADVNPIALTPSGGGNGETHWFYSSDSPLYNNSNGAVTINVPSGASFAWVNGIRESGSSSTTVIALGDIRIVLRARTNDFITATDGGDGIWGASIRITENSTGDLISEGFSSLKNDGSLQGRFRDSAFNAALFTDDITISVKDHSFGRKRFLPVNVPVKLSNGFAEVDIFMDEDTNVLPSNTKQTGIVRTGFSAVAGVSSSSVWNSYPILQRGWRSFVRLPLGTDRKLIVWFVTRYDSGAVAPVASTTTYDGSTLNLVTSVNLVDTYGDSNEIQAFMYYYDISDADEGEKVIEWNETIATSRPLKGIHVAVLGDMATGAAEDSATVTGDQTATDPSFTINNTSANAVSIGLVLTDALDIPAATGVGDIQRTGAHPTDDSGTLYGNPRTNLAHQLTMVGVERTSSGSHSIGADYTPASQTYAGIAATFARK